MRRELCIELRNGLLFLFGNYSKEFFELKRDDVFIDGISFLSVLEFSYDKEKLVPGEFIALKKVSSENKHYEEIEIIAHNLPIGEEVFLNWEIISGLRERLFLDNKKITEEWSFVEVESGKKLSFAEVVKKMKLKEIEHPYGKIWLKDTVLVAVNAKPIWKIEKRKQTFERLILGNKNFFISENFFILKSRFGPGKRNAIEKRIKKVSREEKYLFEKFLERNLSLEHLCQNDWYPIRVTEGFVLWGVRVFLYSKNFSWELAFCVNRKQKGGRLYDSSAGRFERVKKFFLEKIGTVSFDPKNEYVRLASEKCPAFATGVYRQDWKPDFPGWNLSDFGCDVECRWKESKYGFYGVINDRKGVVLQGDEDYLSAYDAVKKFPFLRDLDRKIVNNSAKFFLKNYSLKKFIATYQEEYLNASRKKIFIFRNSKLTEINKFNFSVDGFKKMMKSEINFFILWLSRDKEYISKVILWSVAKKEIKN